MCWIHHLAWPRASTATMERFPKKPNRSLKSYFKHFKIKSAVFQCSILSIDTRSQDTIVRWSSAKGIARIAERLPSEFADQVFDTIVGLFSIHSVAAASIYDIPSIAESTWHGACLACAEMARRGLVADAKLPELIDWLYKVSQYQCQSLFGYSFSLGTLLRYSERRSFNRV